MWHHATYRGDELIVLGFRRQMNDCMLVRLSGLPMNEQSELRKIAGSRSAQQSSYLIPILRRMESPFGNDWFSYLAKKMEQRNGPVFTLPIKEIQDSLDPDQKAIFKGYGKGRKNQAFEVDTLGREYDQSEDNSDEEIVDTTPRVQRPTDIRVEHGLSQNSSINSDLDYKLDLLIETVSSENRQTQQILNKLLTVLADNATPKPSSAQPKKSREKSPVRSGSESQPAHIDL